MKPWKKQDGGIESISIPPLPMQVPVSPLVYWDCKDCNDRATIMFEGTSFCRGCLDKNLRSNYRS